MKRKSIITILATLLLLVLAVSAFTACGKKGNDKDKDTTHTHTYATEWSKDETNHWHAATCEHTSEKKDVAAHIWNDGEITTPATEEADGIKTFTCTVCKQTKTEAVPALGHEHTYSTEWSKNETEHWHAATCEHTSEKKDVAAHIWNDGEITTPATEEADGVKTFTCTVCKQTKTEAIPATGHEHTYAAEWSKNETEHWHAATCKHTSERKDVTTHIYDDDNDASCNVCGYERVAKENGVSFNISARTYDKTEQGLTAEECSVKGGTVVSVEYKVKGAADTEYSLTAPVNAGEYTVRIKVTGNAEYKNVEATADFTIAKRELFYGQAFSANREIGGKPVDYTEGLRTRAGDSYWGHGSFKNTNKIDGDEIYLKVTFAANEAGAELISCEMSGKDADNYFLSDTVKPYLN